MTLPNDGEKVNILIELLERHIDKLPSENSFANYLESIRGFLKTKDPILQKAAFSNSELFIDNFSNVLNNHITSKQAVGSLIAAFDKVGYADSMDAAMIIIKFEDFLKQMPVVDAENFYEERWITDKYRG
ncbi:hypothetical protein [Paenibacillus periandrae]|uniref:hypothetical protein n=1 Tax=Paenibacillus periandrae TaxID=1761741 RepID=UPI001F096A2E|nr:hypothetical protein [Paenibacillus periandrae]